MQLEDLSIRHCALTEGLRAPAAKQIHDPIARHAKEPPAYMLDRFHHPVGFEQFEEDVLQDVFGLSGICHITANEAAQA